MELYESDAQMIFYGIMKIFLDDSKKSMVTYKKAEAIFVLEI